jgi:signal transduction histidine kinase
VAAEHDHEHIPMPRRKLVHDPQYYGDNVLEKLGARRQQLPAAISADTRLQVRVDLISHLQRTTERDNARVAKLLHDELGSLIVAAIMDIAWVEAHFGADSADSVEKLSRARLALRTAIDIKRRLIDELHPTLLDEVGLFAALSWHLKKTWGEAGVVSTGKYPASELRLQPHVKIGLFRIAQEALEISVKHPLVKSASLTVTVNRDKLLMRFANDGTVSIPVSALAGAANILLSMRNRLRVLGGRVRITARQGGGTMILATVPLTAAYAA